MKMLKQEVVNAEAKTHSRKGQKLARKMKRIQTVKQKQIVKPRDNPL